MREQAHRPLPLRSSSMDPKSPNTKCPSASPSLPPFIRPWRCDPAETRPDPSPIDPHYTRNLKPTHPFTQRDIPSPKEPLDPAPHSKSEIRSELGEKYGGRPEGDPGSPSIDVRTAPVANRRLMSDTEPTNFSAESYLMDEGEASTIKESCMSVEGEHSTIPGNGELSINQLFLLDPCQLSQLNSSHSDVTLNTISDNLNAINIDDHALEALLASMENSADADESGHSFEHWRAAVRKMVAEARRLENPGTTKLAEAIMDDRAKALMEVQMSLNDERIHLSKAKKAILDRSNAEAAIAAEIEALEMETDSLRMNFFMKERSLEARIQELKAAEQEQVYLEEKLEDLKEAFYETEEIVSKVQATLDCECGRLKDILPHNITHLHSSNHA